MLVEIGIGLIVSLGAIWFDRKADKLAGEGGVLLDSGRGGASVNLSLHLPASSLVSPTSRPTRGTVSQFEHYSVTAPPPIPTDQQTRTGTTASWCLGPSAPSSSPPCCRSRATGS